MLFKKNVLSSSVAMALVGVTMPSFTQAEELEIEEVIVEGGIRASLKKSMDIKRDTVGVADAISAEDMGKFPDTNLAEALQRITGVSIDRSRGEGNQVTVRGFGPSYNMVTLNGRQMPTHNGASRAFSFSDLAAQGISAVVVNKTGNASVPSGGIGALIDIVTTKPLEAGSVLSVGGKAMMDTSTVTGDGSTPELAGLYSETFADDTVGVALSLSYQERANADRSAGVSGWKTFFSDTVRPQYAVRMDGYENPTNNIIQTHINRPQQSMWPDLKDTQKVTTSVPQNLGYRLTEYEAERVNGQLTVQFRPFESFTGTIDYTYSGLDYGSKYQDLSAWFNGQNARTVDTQWDTSTPNGTPIYYREENTNNDLANGIGSTGSTTQNNSVGLNLEWFATDSLQLEFDHHQSSARSGAKDPINGTSSLITIASFNRCVSKAIFDPNAKDLPLLILGNDSEACVAADEMPAGDTDREIYASDMIITGSVFSNGQSKMDIEQTRFSGTFDISDLSSIDFGLELTEVTNETKSAVVQRNSWSGISEPGDLEGHITKTDISGIFDAISGGDHEYLQAESFTIGIKELSDLARNYPVTELPSSKGGTCVEDRDGDGRDFYCASEDWSDEKNTTEKTDAYYFQLVHDNEILGLPFNLRTGLRYEKTEVFSTATVPTVSGTTWDGNEFTIIKDFENLITEPGEGKYNLLLPNLDVNVELTYDLVGRFSLSKTVTRPNYNDIKGGTTVNGDSYKYGSASASSGNPGLLPIESSNLDVSLEWYYDETDYLSIGYFKKDVANFIGRGFETLPKWNVPDVTLGGVYKAEAFNAGLQPFQTDLIAEELSDAVSPQNPLVAQIDPETGEYPAGFTEGDPRSVVDGSYLLFEVGKPVNEKNAKVYGWEFNLQHNFGETGFGFIANYTKPWADIYYDTIITTQPCPDDSESEVCLVEQFALSGLSESANLIGFYDKDGISVRAALNWRDDFFNGDGQAEGAVFDDSGVKIGNNPTQTESYMQLDLSASYEVSESLTILFDGLNVLDGYSRTYGREKMQHLNITQTGPRYNLGFRYTFW